MFLLMSALGLSTLLTLGAVVMSSHDDDGLSST